MRNIRSFFSKTKVSFLKHRTNNWELNFVMYFEAENTHCTLRLKLQHLFRKGKSFYLTFGTFMLISKELNNLYYGYAGKRKSSEMSCNLKSIRDSTVCPTYSELFGFEFDPDAALLLFHENGGLDRFNCNDISTEKTSLLIQPISTDIKDRCIASYQKAVDYNGDLFACGACGVRTYSQDNYSTFRVDDPLLVLLQLKSEDVSKHNSLGVFKSVCSVFEHNVDHTKKKQNKNKTPRGTCRHTGTSWYTSK